MSGIPRRDWIKGVAAGSFAALTASAADRKRNRVIEENALPGSTDWQLTRVRPTAGNGFRQIDIEGYCSRQSVSAGETLDIMVSTDPPRDFQIEIFRTGYYGGKGARLMATLGPFPGKKQPTPEPGEKNLHECRWEPCTSARLRCDVLLEQRPAHAGPRAEVQGVSLQRPRRVLGHSPV